MESDPHRELCKRCYKFYSALDVVFTNDPPLRVAYKENFNEKGRRTLIIQSHRIRSEQKVQWLREMLQYYTGILELYETGFKPRFARPPWADFPRPPWTNGIKHPTEESTEEHILCHIVRYNKLIPHSDSARYRPSSHVPSARSNPLCFVKSAR